MEKYIEEQNWIYMIITRFWSYMYEILHRPMAQLRLVGQGILVIKAPRPYWTESRQKYHNAILVRNS